MLEVIPRPMELCKACPIGLAAPIILARTDTLPSGFLTTGGELDGKKILVHQFKDYTLKTPCLAVPTFRELNGFTSKRKSGNGKVKEIEHSLISILTHFSLFVK